MNDSLATPLDPVLVSYGRNKASFEPLGRNRNNRDERHWGCIRSNFGYLAFCFVSAFRIFTNWRQ